MNVLFIHPNFPAQFGLVAHYLTTKLRWSCTYLTSIDTTQLTDLSFTHINYRLRDNEPQPKVFYNPESIQGLYEHLAAIYRGMRSIPQYQPDLVIGHMSYGTMLYLRDLYTCPFLGFFEWMPRQFWGNGLTLRREFPPPEAVRLANSTFHSLTHLHLHACDAGYTPTEYQRSMCLPEWQYKLKVLFEGVDCQIFQPRERPTTFRDLSIPTETKVITYVSRGLESTRGFDVFMKFAKRICDRRNDVLFLVVGAERTNYGHELHHIGNQSFKQWVLNQDNYDLDKIRFLDLVQVGELKSLYNLSDLHVFLSVPYTISWSVFQAMASGCPILATRTSATEEVISDGVEGRLVDFEDLDQLVERGLHLLDHPEEAKQLGRNARLKVMEQYELGVCLSRMAEFFQSFDRRQNVTDEAFSSL